MKIELQGVAKKFKSLRALDSVSVTIEPGQVLESLAALCAWLTLGVMFYARRFNRGRFDLVPATKTASGFSQ